MAHSVVIDLTWGARFKTTPGRRKIVIVAVHPQCSKLFKELMFAVLHYGTVPPLLTVSLPLLSVTLIIPRFEI